MVTTQWTSCYYIAGCRHLSHLSACCHTLTSILVISQCTHLFQLTPPSPFVAECHQPPIMSYCIKHHPLMSFNTLITSQYYFLLWPSACCAHESWWWWFLNHARVIWCPCRLPSWWAASISSHFVGPWCNTFTTSFNSSCIVFPSGLQAKGTASPCHKELLPGRSPHHKNFCSLSCHYGESPCFALIRTLSPLLTLTWCFASELLLFVLAFHPADSIFAWYAHHIGTSACVPLVHHCNQGDYNTCCGMSWILSV